MPGRPGRPPLVICMGVSGSGKSTVGRALASRLGWAFVDADALHPAANVAKMRRGIPLDDADRAPWLARVRAEIERQRARGDALVLACSALTPAHRRSLAPVGAEPVYVVLEGAPQLLAARLAARRGHYMPASLLASQLAIFQPPPGAITVDIALPVERAVALITDRLGPVAAGGPTP